MDDPLTEALARQVAAVCAPLPVEGGAVAQAMQACLDAQDAPTRTWLQALPPAAWQAWARVLCVSPYAREQLQRHPDWLPALLRGEPAPARPELADVADLAGLQRALRWFRHRHMVEIIWRDLNEADAYPRTVAALSRLAETCLQAALDFLQAELHARFGRPRDAQGGEVPFVVLGMGKLGGAELNLSSDIDLIFAYGAAGETDGPRSLDNGEFFTRLGRQLIQALNERTADGFVFRVDMRLRPFGDSGPLAVSAEGMEHYYQVHGRDWERYALIKARPVAGDLAFGAELLKTLQPFVYRRYLDFTAFAALRELKTLIDAEVRRKDMRDNIKLGPGGIREVEFIVQAFQLIRGGQVPALRQRNTLAVLEALAARGFLPVHDAEVLRRAYLFLRDLEHRLQMVNDNQTQMLPAAALERERLALAMGCADWEALERALKRYREQVEQHFDLAFAAPQAEVQQQDTAARDLWLWAGMDDDHDEAAAGQLLHLGFTDAAASWQLLSGFGRSNLVSRRLTAQGRARLDQLMPLVLGVCARSPQPDVLLLRFLRLIEAVAGRSAYLALLVENPLALSRLARLLLLSPWVSSELTRYPTLLDEVLDERELLLGRDRERLRRDLAAELAAEPDAEGRMDRLRHFKRTEVFRLARADLIGRFPVEEVTAGLSRLAEVLLDGVLELAWADLAERHGVPRQPDGAAAQFCVVGFGKLGSAEMGYHSDLDLLFLHDSELEGQSDGDRPLANAVFFARLGQRIIYYLSTLTPAGTLYSIDMRLRPSGRSGPLVTSLAHLDDYQRHTAWTWEHQALTRARPIAGSPALRAAFDALRLEVLRQPRDAGQLRRDVRDMRARMVAEHAPGTEVFHVKHSPGGLVDIEFLVQYGRLLRGAADPGLLEGRDTRGGLAALAGHGFLSEADAQDLALALHFYRFLELRLQLLERPGAFGEAEAAEIERLLPSAFRALWSRVAAHRERVRQIWAACLGSEQDVNGET
ncbi:MAG: bifunctional [glutamate--ammonia ligase]-adenylyl-L-tyrosine phosphorylase/[glutamate--ammonia-ligase] adenylyltransferase [Pseudomonadota bacterium]|uniref:bifunctional [glutamate--ammonia ligase]-adenylyl-L-tyrosine phosphorylase/[glutamate--ammonia-ligase] adenylyltransferase n=1 Tax=Thermithiobacillus tepidarius TaxID=929 RepID=UPI00042469D7|nr:bifunctional [glutamate--ammonia ligase]-adenylyl-L-tyrosine phosphorylase/[glutamate--ammonia-ligase] adenylyltransferase [Thermithiobacillus tepidarius]